MQQEEVVAVKDGYSHGALKTVKHLYGEITDVKVTKTKVGSSKKTTTKVLLYVRWDYDIYDDEDDDAEGWLEVIPKYYGMPGRDGWEIVERRPRSDVDAGMDMDVVNDEDSDVDSSDGSSSNESDSDEHEDSDETFSDSEVDKIQQDADDGRPPLKRGCERCGSTKRTRASQQAIV